MIGRGGRGGFGRALGAVAALLVGTAGLTIGAATPAAADPPQFSYLQPPSSLPYGYSSPPDEPIGIFFGDVPDGGTLTFLAEGNPIANCTYPVAAPRAIYMCSLSTLMPGTYTISATYTGGTYDAFTQVMAPDVEIRRAQSKITSTTSTPVNPGVGFAVSATLTGDEEGSDAPVDGVPLTFTVPGDSCTATTSATGEASCTVAAPTTDVNVDDPTTDFDVAIAFAGDDRYLPSTATAGIALAMTPTVTTVTVVPFEGIWGTAAVVTATIVPGDVTGFVAFSDENGPIDGCDEVEVVAGGSASCAYSLPVGYGVVTATYSGDVRSRPSSGQLGTHGLARPTSVDLASPGALTVGSATSVSATVRDLFADDVIVGITVFFTLGDAGCSAATDAAGVASCPITPQNTADTTLEAALILTERYESTPDTISGLTVARQATTTMVAPATATYGVPLAVTATVEPAEADGTVDFRTGGEPIADCEAVPVALAAGSWTATCTTTALGIGTHPVIGTYSGTANTEGSISPSQHVVVTPAGTTLTYTGDTTATVGVDPTVRAVLRSTATGAVIRDQSVSFTWAAAAGSCSAQTDNAGVATCRLDAPTSGGPQTLIVGYAGADDGSFLESSTTADIVVAKAATSTTVQVPASAVYGELTQLVATVSPSSIGSDGRVAFTVDGGPISDCGSVAPIATELGYQATCNTPRLPAGAHQIGATFLGTDGYEASTATPQPLAVSPGPTALEYTGDTSATAGMPITVRARLTRAGNEPVTGPLHGYHVMFSGAGGTCTDMTDESGVAECTITITPTGDGQSATVHVSFAGTAEYAPATTSSGVTIARPTTTALSGPATVGFSLAVGLVATVAPVPIGGTVTFTDGGTPIAACGAVPVAADGTARCTTTPTTLGVHVVTASFTGTDSYLPSTSAPSTFEVVPAHTAVTYQGPTTATVGQPLTVSATLTATGPNPPATGASLAHGALLGASARPLALGIVGQELTFALGDASCTGTTDATGTATCMLPPPATAGDATLQITYTGNTLYEAVTVHVPLVIGAAPMLPATGSDSSIRLALATVLLLAGLATTRVRRRRA